MIPGRLAFACGPISLIIAIVASLVLSAAALASRRMALRLHQLVRVADIIAVAEIGPCDEVPHGEGVSAHPGGLRYRRQCAWRSDEVWHLAETVQVSAKAQPIWSNVDPVLESPGAIDPGRYLVFLRLVPGGWASANDEMGVFPIRDGVVERWSTFRRLSMVRDRDTPTLDVVRKEIVNPPPRQSGEIFLEYVEDDVRSRPADPRTWTERGWEFSRYPKWNFDRAVADFDTAIRLDSRHAYAYAGRGRAHYMLGRYDSAIADLTESIRLHEDGAHYDHLERGWAYILVGDFDSAAADARTFFNRYGAKYVGPTDCQAAILAHFACRMAGRDTAARSDIATAAVRCDTTQWECRVTRYLHGDLSERSLLTTEADTYSRASIRACVGIDLALRGHIQEAEPYLRVAETVDGPLPDACRLAGFVVECYVTDADVHSLRQAMIEEVPVPNAARVRDILQRIVHFRRLIHLDRRRIVDLLGPGERCGARFHSQGFGPEDIYYPIGRVPAGSLGGVPNLVVGFSRDGLSVKVQVVHTQ